MPENIPTQAEVKRAVEVLDAAYAAAVAMEFQLSGDGRRLLGRGADTLTWLLRQADFRAWAKGPTENADKPES